MFKLQHQFNNIAETSQLMNDQMPQFHCHCKCLKCLPPVSSSNTSFQSLNLRSLSQPRQWFLWQVAPERLLDFGECFRLCFKLAVSLQHCNHMTYSIGFIFSEFGGHWSFVMKSGQLARSQFSVLCALWADVTSCWKMNPVGSRRLL